MISYSDEKELVHIMAEMIYRKEKVVTIYQNLHKKIGNYYKPLSIPEKKKMIWDYCKKDLPTAVISKNLIEKILYFLEISEIVDEKMINPIDRFPVKNGELVFKNGYVNLDNNGNSYFTFQGHTEYVSTITTDAAEIFLKQIMPSERNRKQILEAFAVGLLPALRNSVNWDNILLLHGVGANGKSVLLHSIIQKIFGSCVSNISLDQMGMRFHLAGLLGKRLNICSENKTNRINEDPNLKALTSGDSVSVEQKHKDPIFARLYAVPIFAVNKEPSIGDITYAMKRRLHIVNFPNIFTDNPKRDNEFKADPSLRNSKSEKIIEIQQSMLKLIVQTAERLYREKEITSNDLEAIDLAQTKNSHHRLFITESFEFDYESFIESFKVFEAYIGWCSQQGIYDPAKKGFAWTSPDDKYDKVTKTKDRLTRRLLELYPDKIFTVKINGKRGIKGLKLKENLDFINGLLDNQDTNK